MVAGPMVWGGLLQCLSLEQQQGCVMDLTLLGQLLAGLLLLRGVQKLAVP